MPYMLDRSRVSSISVPRLERFSLREQVRTVLRARVITGELEEGRLYSVGDFATLLGVSATPVREALGDLVHHGLVQVLPNKGFVVPSLTDHDLDEIFELRMLLEIPTVAAAAGKLDADALDKAHQIVERCASCAAQQDLAGFLDSDREFHLGLLRGAGNARLVEIVDRLRDQARLYGLRTLPVIDLVASAAEHELLLAAVSANDDAEIRRQLAHHLEHTRGMWAARSDTELR